MIQQLFREVVLNDDASEDDKFDALISIADALYPNPFQGKHGMDLEESESETAVQNAELAAIVADMNREEATFAGNLKRILEAKDMTQTQLAFAAGLGQSAIANLIARDCRPQKRTVFKLAAALEVEPSVLWPGITE